MAPSPCARPLVVWDTQQPDRAGRSRFEPEVRHKGEQKSKNSHERDPSRRRSQSGRSKEKTAEAQGERAMATDKPEQKKKRTPPSNCNFN
ncbi:MAG: hypothetical protein CMK09_02470 [Ponticaulis sp.]|nr:hypothetical protein [Ponticaulis sp.]